MPETATLPFAGLEFGDPAVQRALAALTEAKRQFDGSGLHGLTAVQDQFRVLAFSLLAAARGSCRLAAPPVDTYETTDGVTGDQIIRCQHDQYIGDYHAWRQDGTRIR